MKNITFWTVLAGIAVATLVLYRLAQPSCEPCVEGQDCPPCISNWQIAIIIAGIIAIVAGILLKKNRPTTTKK